MRSKRLHSQPKSFQLVSTDNQRLAVRILREAAGTGITKDEMARRLGGLTHRTVDRTVECLEDQGAVVLRPRRVTEEGRSLIHFVLKKGPRWDERTSPDTEAILGLAEMAKNQGAEESALRDLVQLFSAYAADRLTTADKVVLQRFMEGEAPASAEVAPEASPAKPSRPRRKAAPKKRGSQIS